MSGDREETCLGSEKTCMGGESERNTSGEITCLGRVRNMSRKSEEGVDEFWRGVGDMTVGCLHGSLVATGYASTDATCTGPAREEYVITEGGRWQTESEDCFAQEHGRRLRSRRRHASIYSTTTTRIDHRTGHPLAKQRYRMEREEERSSGL